ncbi:MAG: glycine cleavage system protein GcvH [Armatimonadetes bacterium]|nr:glycine cleavage system protein GcvH [Armatimonadota bacterium]
MIFPTDLKYTKSHEWVRVNGDTATVGISDHAQSEMGDVVYVELPEVGRTLQSQESFGTIESVKTVSDVYAPVAGEVVEANAALVAQSELLNTAPYEEGWLVKIKMSDPREADLLMGAEAYQASLDD